MLRAGTLVGLSLIHIYSEKVNVTGVPGAFEEDDIIPDGLVKGDYVAVYKDSFTGNNKLVKAEKVTGKVDATKGSGNTITDVEIDGNWYTSVSYTHLRSLSNPLTIQKDAAA